MAFFYKIRLCNVNLSDKNYDMMAFADGVFFKIPYVTMLQRANCDIWLHVSGTGCA